MTTPATQQRTTRFLLLIAWLCLLLWLISACCYNGFRDNEIAKAFWGAGMTLPFICFVVSLAGGLKANKKLQDYFGLPLLICSFICLAELMWLQTKLPIELRNYPNLAYCIGFVLGGVWYSFSKAGKRDIRKRYWMLVFLYGLSTAVFFAIALWVVWIIIACVIWFFI